MQIEFKNGQSFKKINEIGLGNEPSHVLIVLTPQDIHFVVQDHNEKARITLKVNSNLLSGFKNEHMESRAVLGILFKN